MSAATSENWDTKVGGTRERGRGGTEGREGEERGGGERGRGGERGGGEGTGEKKRGERDTYV